MIQGGERIPLQSKESLIASISYGQATRQGTQIENQDINGINHNAQGIFLVCADGISGSPSGRETASLATNAALQALYAGTNIMDAMLTAQERVKKRATYGTTLLVAQATVSKKRDTMDITVGSIGDSIAQKITVYPHSNRLPDFVDINQSSRKHDQNQRTNQLEIYVGRNDVQTLGRRPMRTFSPFQKPSFQEIILHGHMWQVELNPNEILIL